MRIYVVGNRLVEIDSLPIRLLPTLKKLFPKFDFVEFDPNDELREKNPIIIDTVINTKEVALLTDIDRIELNTICSLHDFDLGYSLKLLKKLGEIESVRIIGVPPAISEDVAIRDIAILLASMESKNI